MTTTLKFHQRSQIKKKLKSDGNANKSIENIQNLYSDQDNISEAFKDSDKKEENVEITKNLRMKMKIKTEIFCSL